MTIYQFSVRGITGEEISLDRYRGQVLLIVNTASGCGFTPQYEGLEALYRRYRDKGFVVLGFPCNQFGGQEPGAEAEIATFCKTQFDVDFPMFSKIDVNGEHAHPLFRYLKKEKAGILGSGIIKWNFTKFLIGRDGEPVARFAPTTKPEEITDDIEKALAA
ncbi:glutathione peroxidase [Martelella endophytica]|uniref:Glutathione peroxidase n=1 Tax=Martelella endophytica TaxID=1486262 RepID=A0A0D5LP36_MAREN|nr:glutathione peroxidase [Martelella endophytica]AJY45989.1 glutathione peroxidase [Martelella endophytica]